MQTRYVVDMTVLVSWLLEVLHWAEFGMTGKRILPTADGLILISGVDAIVQR